MTLFELLEKSYTSNKQKLVFLYTAFLINGIHFKISRFHPNEVLHEHFVKHKNYNIL